MKDYEIRDISLAPQGHQKIAWVRDHMPLLRGLEEEFAKTKPFAGVTQRNRTALPYGHAAKGREDCRKPSTHGE